MHRHRKSAKRRTLLRALGASAWCAHSAALDCLFGALVAHESPRGPLCEMYGYEPTEAPRIVRLGPVALLPIYGMLTARETYVTRWLGGTSYERVCRMLDRALADQQVATIVLDINSPGGESQGAFECADRIFAGRRQKRIVSIAHHMAASGGYLLAAAASELIACPTGDVGSVGTVRVVSNLSKYFSDMGMTYEVLAHGERKADGNPYQPLTPEARAAILEHDKTTYDLFTGALARYRKPPAVANHGDGRCYIGSAALAAGLVDRIADFDALLRELGAIQPSPTVTSYSQIAAGLPAAELSTVPVHPSVSLPIRTVPMKISAEVRAALLARGLIVADASDAACQAALNAFYAGRGITCPTSDAEIIAALQHTPAAAPAATVQAQTPTAAPAIVAQPTQVVTQPAAVPATATVASQPAIADPASIQAQGVLNERARQRDLRSRGALLGVAAAQIDAAIDAGTPVETSVNGWVAQLGQDQRPAVRVTAGESAPDRIFAQGLEAFSLRLRLIKPEQISGDNHFRNARMVRVAAAFLQSAGIRCDHLEDEDIARLAMRQSRDEIVYVGGQPMIGGSARPADFPNLLSALVGKILDTSHQFSPATYKNWAFQIDSVPDFKPKTIGRLGEVGELATRMDGQKSEEALPSEEQSWLSVDEYAKHIKITPRMAANDDLGAFSDLGTSFNIGHELRLNRLCVELLTSDATAGDSKALFHADHLNAVSGGGVPSNTQLSKHRKLFRVMTGVSGKEILNLTVAHILVPSALETDAEQTLDPQRILPVPTADTSVNTFRGRVGWSVEPMLDAASAAIWYAFAHREMSKPIVYAFQRGYEGGRSRSWYEDATQSRVIEVEGRFGANVNDWRGVTRNPGS